MRKVWWVAALVLGLGVASPALAQRSLSSYGGIDPNRIVNKPVDLSGAIAPVAPPAQKPFSLSNFFARIAIPGLPQRIAVSPLPAPSSFPSTQYKNAISPVPIKK